MVSAERQYTHLKHFQEFIGLTKWQIKFEKVSPRQVTNEKIRSNNSLVALCVDDAEKKQATIFHTREVRKEDIVHELVHLAYPDWQIHEDVVVETRRIIRLESKKSKSR